MAGCCEHDNEPSDSLRCEKILEQLLKYDSFPWSQACYNTTCLVSGAFKTPRNKIEAYLRKESSGALLKIKQPFRITFYEVSAQEHRMNVTQTTKITYGKEKCIVNTLSSNVLYKHTQKDHLSC